MKNKMNKRLLKKIFKNLEEYICSVLLLIMTIVTFINVLTRHFIELDIAFTQELVTIMFLWVSLLSASAAFRYGSHIGFTFLIEKLKGKSLKIAKMISIAACITLYLVWAIFGYKMVQTQIYTGLHTPSLNLPGYIIGLSIPISAIFSIFRIIQSEMLETGGVK